MRFVQARRVDHDDLRVIGRENGAEAMACGLSGARRNGDLMSDHGIDQR